LVTCADLIPFCLKKNSIKIAIACIIILCAFLFTSNSAASKNVVLATTLPKPIKAKETASFVVKHFPINTTKNVRHKLDSLLIRANKRQDFHGSVLVAKNGKILYDSQIGFADFRKKVLLNKKSLFQLASVSKQFTAAAIMLLKEQNKLQLSDSVTAYYPNFPYKNVTIKNLLNHTAGLPKYFWVAEHKWNQQKAPSNSEMMDLLASSNVLRFFKPGHGFDYSNTNYMVLASIVEKISGISFSNFLKDNIFDPLQMKNSYVYSFEKDSIKKNQLDGYRLYKGWRHLKIRSTVNDAIVGDKNVYTTAEDLFKWTNGLNSEKILTKESVNLMYAKGETISGRKVPYGLGFRIDSEENNSVYHRGRWNGFSTALTKYLDDDLVVIILEHTSYRDIKSLNTKIKDIVTDNFIL